MAEICNNDITNDMLLDCDNTAVAGIEVNVLLVNSKDINRTTTAFDATNKLLCTNFDLNAGKKGFLIQGVKQIFSASAELVKKEMGFDKWKHTFTGVILNMSADNLLQLQQMSEGANLVAVIETKFKGEDNKDAFHILGYKQGLELATATWSSNENEGTVQIELSSVDGYEEPNYVATLLETDYDTTKTAFDNKFLAPSS